MDNKYENEVWTFVKGYEDKYLVSNYGRVWSNHYDRELKPYEVNGYKYVHLSNEGEGHGIGVHRLVAENFIADDILHDILFDNLVVHHIDGNKQNNKVDNLALTTASAHMSFHKTGVESSRKRSVRMYNGETGEFIKEFDSLTAAAEEINGNVGEISRAIKKGYQARGYRFTFNDQLDCYNQKGEKVAEIGQKQHRSIIKVFNNEDELVATCYSLKEVGELIGRTTEAVRVALNKNRACNGYTFIRIK